LRLVKKDLTGFNLYRVGKRITEKSQFVYSLSDSNDTKLVRTKRSKSVWMESLRGLEAADPPE